MPKIEIDRDRALELLREAVEARGTDYVYPDLGACEYLFAVVEDDDSGTDVVKPLSKVDDFEIKELQPGCKVGFALHRAGVPLELMIDADGDSDDLYLHLVDKLGEDIDITDDARRAFRDAQRAQDWGYTWGFALQAARDGYEVPRHRYAQNDQ